jgi:hypothetical protein
MSVKACLRQPRSKLSEMRPKAMDSLYVVEAVILIEEANGTDIPSDGAEHFR